MREYKNSSYKNSDLIALIFTNASMLQIADALLISEAQAQRAASALYKRAKVANRVELMAVEIERLRQRKDRAA